MPKREPLIYPIGSGVELEVQFAEGPVASKVQAVRWGEQIIYPPVCDKSASGLCTRAHRTVRGDPGGDTRDSMFEMGRELLVASAWSEDEVVHVLFAATVIGSPVCGTHAFWLLRADVRGVRVTEPVRGCFLGGAGTSDDSKAFEILDTSPPTYIFRSPLYLPGEVIDVFTLDEGAMVFTRRYSGKSKSRKLGGSP